MNFKIVSAALAATTAGLAIALPLTANHTYKNGVEKGTAAGIIEGRKGYVKGYEGGLVAVEGHDGRGFDYNCSTAQYFYRDSAGIVMNGTLKAGVGYNYNDNLKTWNNSIAGDYKWMAESTCRALGYQP